MEAVVLALTTSAVSRGLGHWSAYLSQEDTEAIGFGMFIINLTAVWSSCAARMSVAFLLLEIGVSQAWRVTLRLVVVSQFVMGISFNAVELVRCRPVAAMWRPVEGAQCFSWDQAMAYSFVFIGRQPRKLRGPFLKGWY